MKAQSMMEKLIGHQVVADYHHREHEYNIHVIHAGSAARCAECAQWYDKGEDIWIVNDMTDKDSFGAFDSEECAFSYINAR
jgi:hypothetical protein